MANRFDEQAIDLVYEAGINPALWSDALGLMCEALGADSVVQLIQSRDVAHFSWAGFDAFPAEAYFVHQQQFRDWSGKATPLSVFTIDELVPPEIFLKSGFYNDVIRPFGGSEAGLGAVLLRDGVGDSVTVFGRSSGKHFHERARMKLRDLIPHLRRAVATTAALNGGARSHAAIAAMEQAPGVCIVVDRQYRPILTTVGGEQVLAAGDGCRLGRTGRIEDRAGVLAATLSRVFAAHRRDLAVREAILQRAEGKPAWFARVHRAIENEGIAVIWLEEDRGPASLARRYGLTAREQQVVEQLARGIVGVAELAAALDVSVNTARTHLHRVFAKTATHRQAELINLLR